MDTSFERHQGLLRKLSVKAHMRMQEVDPSITYDDIYQDMCIAFMKAQQGFDESHGAQFTTYFGRTCWNEFMKVRDSLDRTRRSLNYPVNLEAMVEQDEDGDGSIYEVLRDPNANSPEQEVSDEQQFHAKLKNLSPYARAILEVLKHPSQDALNAYSRYREAQLAANRSPAEEITLAFIVRWLWRANRKNHIGMDRWKSAKKELFRVYELDRRTAK